MATSIPFRDLISQETRRNPSAFFARLHEQEQFSFIHDYDDIGRAWIVTAYDDVMAVLKDPRFIKNIQKIFLSSDGSAGKSTSGLHRFLSTISLLIEARYETTVNLIGNGMLALLVPPDQMRLLSSPSKEETRA